MKIQTILNEDFSQDMDAGSVGDTQPPATSVPKLRFNDLSTVQVGTLQRIANGSIDVDSASESDYDTMTELADLGLLDQEYQLNDRGAKVVAIAKKMGGSSELLAARAKQAKLGQSAAPQAPAATDDDAGADLGGDDLGLSDDDDGAQDDYDFRLNR